MNHLSHFVTLHPYFKVHAGKQEEFKAGMLQMVETTKTEEKNLFYEFTTHEDEVFCREGYTDAAGLLTHLGNVETLLKAALEIADITRLEVHGPAGELDQLREALGGMNPTWFPLDCGVTR